VFYKTWIDTHFVPRCSLFHSFCFAVPESVEDFLVLPGSSWAQLMNIFKCGRWWELGCDEWRCWSWLWLSTNFFIEERPAGLILSFDEKMIYLGKSRSSCGFFLLTKPWSYSWNFYTWTCCGSTGGSCAWFWAFTFSSVSSSNDEDGDFTGSLQPQLLVLICEW
jgi:hypothetical protein